MTAEYTNKRNLVAEMTDFSQYLRKDYDAMSDEIDAEFRALSKEQALRIEVDNSLESALKELESLQSQLPKEQMNALFEQCSQNAIDAVVGHFGLAAVVLDSKPGGNITTANNFKKGVTANESDKQLFQNYYKKQQPKGFQRNDGVCNYDKLKDKIRDNSPIQVHSEYTGQTMERGMGVGKAQLDHVISVKELDSNPDAHLFLSDSQRAELANIPENLKWLGTSANASKNDRDLMEWGNDINKETGKTNFETFGIDKEKAQQIKDRAEKAQNKKILTNKVEKYSSEALITGGIDAGKMALHSAIGMILKEFIEGMSDELKTLFKEFGNESLGDIFKRFAKRLKQIWANLRARWKDIIAGSFEAGIVAFFGNLVVFVINIVFTTLKRIVQIIRAGFTSLYQAVKKLFDKNIPQNERLFEASKIFVAGLIGAVTMLSGEYITAWLKAIPGLNALFNIPLPFLNETIGDALVLCISAALGAVLSTIAIYYMDKWANDKKIAGLQIQMIAQSGIVVRCQVVKSWFSLLDAWRFLEFAIEDTQRKLNNARLAIKSSHSKAQQSIDELQDKLDELKALQDTRRIR